MAYVVPARSTSTAYLVMADMAYVSTALYSYCLCKDLYRHSTIQLLPYIAMTL